MLAIAARHADIVAMLAAPLSQGKMADPPEARLAASVAQQVDSVRQAAGARFPELELSVFATIASGANRLDAATQLAQQRGWHSVPVEAVLDMPTVLSGSVEQMLDDLVMRRERYGISYIVVRDRQLDEIEPLVRRLADA
jgi:hypothetical protein